MQRLSADKNIWPSIRVKKRIIRPGYYYAQAPELAKLLGMLGDLPASTANRLANNNKKVLSRALVSGVKTFQARHGLKVDGVIGPKTYQWLALSKQRRLQMLALNGERMRLWQIREPSMLIVNIPNFKLDLWLDNKHVLDSRVIVGKPTRPTPLMNTKMQSVVLNPHWNVPTSIMRKDIIPKAKYDRGYLSRNNFKIIRNWQTSEIIPTSAINWRRVSSKSFPYRLQQKPGKRNALGRYKFIIKNKQAIFLHDTPSKRLFNRTERALSSGCVRVQAAEKLASVLLKYDGFSNKRWNKLRSRRKTQTLPLGQTLPVQFIYQTAWVDKDNKIQYRNDIYDHDKVGHMSQNESKITSVVKR
jgi:murein L,D-transpeptidase YcbB/YkuD